MNYIKTFRKIKNHKLIIDIPEDFKSEDVEVIVLPVNADTESNDSFMKVSEESFKEWDNDSDEIYNNM
ncbi:MAG: hypothetical protein IT281_01490 [Ignavibacteria bacterium]|nr:hypothetical protein [Ignavibacteria bacterium]